MLAWRWLRSSPLSRPRRTYTSSSVTASTAASGPSPASSCKDADRRNIMNPGVITSPNAAPVEYSTHAVGGNYYLSVGYLRAFVTLLVVAHHAVLAYHPYSPPPPISLVASPMWQIFPVVDAHKW